MCPSVLTIQGPWGRLSELQYKDNSILTGVLVGSYKCLSDLELDQWRD